MVESVLMGMASAAVLLVGSFVVLWLGRASARGSLGRNHSVGLRTRWTLASDKAWDAGHRAGAPRVHVAGIGGVIGAAVAVTSGFLPLAGASENLTNGVITAGILGSCVWLVTWVLAAGAAANRAARAVSEQSLGTKLGESE
ncbi:hypothetical protein FM113_07435 [Leucobacter sp. 7(1)]|uniref:SdpI family protein n=1 Tax=Leucobacter sp. 7(1) TaxID=1255613 RepID=UPI00097E9E13|nr:SdpI family protein [Leucobacter sp. 7(1)]SJN09859.1 hypothetical protein FM113_07435 [Leucobacter sp. 7(1)]